MSRYTGDTNLGDREKRQKLEIEALKKRLEAERKKRNAAEQRARELGKRLKK